MLLTLGGPKDLEVTRLHEPELTIEGDAGGEGFGPLQMFAASLALCTASVLISYDEGVAETGVQSLRLAVSWEYASDPNRIGRVALEVIWPELPETRIRAAERAAASCTIHHTLANPPRVSTTVRRGSPG